MRIGAQLYTVRDFCQTKEGIEETFRRVADMGYEIVQMSGSCPYEGEWLQEMLNQYHLRCVLTHYSPAEMLADPVQVAKKHQLFGCRHIGLGSFKSVCEQYDAFRAQYTPVMEKFREQGHLFMYHNHGAEFEKLPNGKPVIYDMRDTFAADLMGFTLDTYWIQYGGMVPDRVIRDFAGRVPCIHLKDMGITGKEHRILPVGSGTIDFERVLSACEDAKTEFVLVEQDHCNGEDPFDCLKKSYDYLHALGLK